MNNLLVKKHVNSIAILVFVFSFSIIMTFEPAIIFKKDGSLRNFGVGYKQKTIAPAWLIAIILAIFSYLFALLH